MPDQKKRINYYPFGLKHKGYNGIVNGRNHRYGFGGKEEQDEIGRGWVDITARNYEPSLGRWMNIDPLAEQMRRHSPYNYAFDNPIYFMDPDGMMAVGANECPSCETEQDWIDYQAQIENQAVGFGGLENMVANVSFLSTSVDEAGHTILFKDGEAVDINRHENRLSAFGDFFMPLIEGVPKAIANFFKGKSSTQTTKVAEEVAEVTEDVTTQVINEAKRVNPDVNTTTLEPGPNAGRSIPARSKSQRFTAKEKATINEIGKTDGCHTCGATSSGRKSGNFTPDHQPVSSLVPDGTPQALFPHCAGCSSSQGGITSGLLRRGYDPTKVIQATPK